MLAQVALAALALSVLVFKRWRERPQRPHVVWLLDVSKQIISQGTAHICGIIIALVVHQRATLTSECSWYFVAFTVDTTAGVLFTIALHSAALRLAEWHSAGVHRPLESDSTPVGVENEPWSAAIAACGSYGVPPSLRRWGLQAAEWTICVIIARFLCGTLVRWSSSLQTRAHATCPTLRNSSFRLIMLF